MGQLGRGGNSEGQDVGEQMISYWFPVSASERALNYRCQGSLWLATSINKTTERLRGAMYQKGSFEPAVNVRISHSDLTTNRRRYIKLLQRLSQHKLVSSFDMTISGAVAWLPPSEVPTADSLCLCILCGREAVCGCFWGWRGVAFNYNVKLLSQGLICWDERKACLPPEVQYSTYLPN